MRPTTRYVWDRYSMAPIALVLIAAIVLGVIVAIRTNSGPNPGRSASPSSSIDRSAPDWFAALPFNCLGSAGLGLAPTRSLALIEGVGAATQTGYDRVVIQFAGGGPAQAQLTTQLGATFPQKPSGKPVTLKGRNGALVTVPGADGHTRYRGKRRGDRSGGRSLLPHGLSGQPCSTRHRLPIHSGCVSGTGAQRHPCCPRAGWCYSRPFTWGRSTTGA